MAFPLAVIPLVGKLLDRILPDKAAKDAAKLAMAELDQNGDLEDIKAEIAQEAERTARHQADMASDSWLSKNIRPGVLLVLTLIYLMLVITDSVDGWEFTMPESHQATLNSMLLAVYGFYFVSRGIEKVAGIMAKK